MRTLTSDRIYEEVKSIVSSAQREVKIASAWLKGKLIEELLDLIQKDVTLEVILRASELQDLLITDERVFKKVREKGGKIYLSDRLHAKFVITDSERAVLGSANFTEPGLSDLSKGNIEAGVFYDTSDGDSQIKELVDYFNKIKSELSYELSPELVGFTINPVKTFSFEFFLVEDGVQEHSYVEVRRGKDCSVLAKVTSIYSYDTGFFANPFTGSESGVFAPIEDFKKIFSGYNRDKDWVKSAIYSYLSGKGNEAKIATAKVLGIVKGNRLETPRDTFPVGSPVYTASTESLGNLLKKRQSGNEMKAPVNIGVLMGSQTPVYIDASEIISRHMLILGTTGSGKSYFASHFLNKLVESESTSGLKIFILDPHGEYFESLKGREKSNLIEHIQFPDTLFPIRGEEVVELIKNNGFAGLVSGNQANARANVSTLNKYVKPSLRITQLRDRSLLGIIEELKDTQDSKDKKNTGESKATAEESGKIIRELIELLKEVFGSEVLENQPEVVSLIEKGLNSSKRIIIYDFKNLNDAVSRVNIAGLVMQEVFKQNKKEKKNRILLLEEAHNFAPEVSYGDVSSGKDNLALSMARRIAAEGRKFNLGLITVTQRPAQVSKYVLSQMNTQVMFRTMNKADLDTISSYIEFSEEETILLLPVLRTGTCVISGMGVPFSLVAEIK